MGHWLRVDFDTIVLGWMALAVGTFILLLFVTAPFGRHTKEGWGPIVRNRWGWFWMELPSFVLILAALLLGSRVNAATWCIGGLWLLHYANRVFIFPFRIRSGDKPMPVTIAASAVGFNLVNAGLNGYFLAELSDYSYDWFGSWQFMVGLPLFVLGMGINLWADERLMNLRRPGETGYVIPRGGLFELVSAPNLFGEVLEWAGFAILAWNLPAASFALWTFANLVPRARDHHRFYLQRFPDYPRTRRAVFPFLY